MNLRHRRSTHVEIMIYMFVLFLGMFTDLYQPHKLHSIENISGITHLCYLADQNTAVPEIKSLTVTSTCFVHSEISCRSCDLKMSGSERIVNYR
jgi:hypothetical protein